MLVEDVMFNLTKQIAIVLDNLGDRNGPCDQDINQKAEGITLQFMQRLPGLREIIETDVQAGFEGILPPLIPMRSSFPIRGSMRCLFTGLPTSCMFWVCRLFRE